MGKEFNDCELSLQCCFVCIRPDWLKKNGLVLDQNLHHSVSDSRFKNLHRFGYGRTFRPTIPNIETPLMERTFDDVTIKIAVAQIGPIVVAMCNVWLRSFV